MDALKLILVDDEEGIRRFLGLSLEDMGYEVKTAANGQEALECLTHFPAPIVLTDIKMPVMDGIELLRHIKETSPDTEVVIITGHGDLDLAIQALKNNAADFITKPINNDMLEISLDRVKEKIRMRQALRDYTENLERLVEEKTRRIVDLERQSAACEVLERFSSVLSSAATDVEGPSGLFNELPCLVSIHNKEMKIVAINSLFQERLGDLVGHESHEVYVGRDAESVDSPVRLTFETSKGQRGKKVLRGKDGEGIPVTVYTAPIPNADGSVGLVLDISVDMTELSRLREELMATRHKYQRLFDEAPCYITVQDLDYNIVELNRRFREVFGDAEGHICYAVKKHRDTPCEDCLLRQTIEDGDSHQKESVVTTKSGERKNVLVVSAPVRDAAGSVRQVIEMYTDITEIRRLQDHLTSLGIMLGSMSHGVKGMLTALDGGLYRLESGLRKQDTQRVDEAVKTLKTMIGRIKKMVLDILYYAKSRALEVEELDASRFLRETAELVRPKADLAGVPFCCEVPEDLGLSEMDATAVSAALVNILENGVDACAGKPDKGGVAMSAVLQEQDLVITISDKGMGMDQETKEKIFTLFFSSKGARGTGLGLFISNQTIEQHGGRIAVESAPGVGTTFVITLPTKPGEAFKAARPVG